MTQTLSVHLYVHFIFVTDVVHCRLNLIKKGAQKYLEDLLPKRMVKNWIFINGGSKTWCTNGHPCTLGSTTPAEANYLSCIFSMRYDLFTINILWAPKVKTQIPIFLKSFRVPLFLFREKSISWVLDRWVDIDSDNSLRRWDRAKGWNRER